MQQVTRMIVVGVALVVGVAGAGCSGTDTATTTAATTTTKAAPVTTTTAAPATTTTVAVPAGSVLIKDYAFNPEAQTAKVGDKVTWTNADENNHYVVSDEGTELDSSPMPPGGTYSHAFAKAGTYAYHCKIHNTMKGTIVVS